MGLVPCVLETSTEPAEHPRREGTVRLILPKKCPPVDACGRGYPTESPERDGKGQPAQPVFSQSPRALERVRAHTPKSQRAGSEREQLYRPLRRLVLSGYPPHLSYRRNGSLFRRSIALEPAAEKFAASTAVLFLPEHRTRRSEVPQSDKLPAKLLPPVRG